MSLSQARCKILEVMLLNEKAADSRNIAKEAGTEFKPANMHLISLAKAGFAISPAKGQYLITQKGKEALGIPATSRECAQQILAYTPDDKAFHFYLDLHKPLSQSANSLSEFSQKLKTIDKTSIEFHICRGDFEKWFTSLGDVELAKKMALLREKGLAGEPLRTKICEIIEERCKALCALA